MKAIETARPPDPAEVYGINTRKDLVAAANFLRWRILDAQMSAGVTIVDPSTTFIEADVTIGQDTIVHPYCVIRTGTRIGARCQVGPFAHLRGGAVLEDEAEVGNFVEVKNSRLGFHTKAKHLSYLGDATIGAKVNIGAGTITANYDRGVKNRTVIEDGAFTGCNTVLVAPVTMRKNSKTGAGAVVPRGQDVPEGTVVVGVPARPLKRSTS
jgi:bifunctional UDP-N-acetylglucosamine pyrophosphorylase/glucosamine-1-phosphate N-acetyltransferase